MVGWETVPELSYSSTVLENRGLWPILRAAVPLPLTSMKLITLRPSFWLTLEGAEAGQDDESQRKKKNLQRSKRTFGLWGQKRKKAWRIEGHRLSRFGEQGWAGQELGGSVEGGRGGRGGSKETPDGTRTQVLVWAALLEV